MVFISDAVSYTHLDVYKRQVIGRNRRFRTIIHHIKKCRLRMHESICIALQKEIYRLIFMNAVLDVYKRQVQFRDLVLARHLPGKAAEQSAAADQQA